MAGFVQQRVVEVGGEHLELAHAGRLLRRFHERHGDGIRLLAGGTAEHPDAERLVAALLEELGQNLALENVERFRVAEKTRHADEHVGVEGVEFLGVAPEEIGVVLQRVLLVQHHAPGDAPLDGGGFVEREIDAGMVAQEEQNFLEAVVSRLAASPLQLRRAPARAPCAAFRVRPRAAASHRPRAPSRTPGRLPPDAEFGRSPSDVGMLRNAGEFLRDVLRRENEIHAARRHRAARHRVVFGRIILRERDPALGLDGLQPQRAVGGRAGKNHADGPLALVLRQRFEKEIDRAMRRARLRARLKLQHALRDAQVRVGRNDIDVIGLDPQIVRDLAHRQRRGARQKLRERAFMLRIEMLHQHEPHARIERQMLEQLP